MKSKRPPITARMKVNALLHRVHLQFGEYLKCAISGEDMKPDDPVEFDHTHALVHSGGHSWDALRPVLKVPHQRKSKRDMRDAAHVKRLRRREKSRPSKKIASSRFYERQRPLLSSSFARRA
jgi:5-methylcytosine-specific restriction endonuclease McrA